MRERVPQMRWFSGVLATAGLVFGAISLTAPDVGAQAGSARGDLARGRLLYETHCGSCHDRSVHGRTERSARSFEEIRAYVARWQREIGAGWQSDDIDAVTAYLNERYYRHPCPSDVCGAPRASTVQIHR